MEIYNHIIEPKLDIFKYFLGNNLCFLDIETTGFSRKYNQVYLIGLVYYNESEEQWNLKQIFAEDLNEEVEILNCFNNMVSNFKTLITYNGDNFDIPFLKSRMKYYKIENKISKINSFDIYREIKANDSYLNFENLKLKTIEENLGIYREDPYTGKDCIDFYFQYVDNNDKALKENILRHNYEDLYYLAEIVEIFEVLESIKSLEVDLDTDNNVTNLNNNKVCIQILDILIKGNVLNIHCKTTPIKKETNIIHYGENFNLKWQNENSLMIDLDIKEGWITPTKKASYIEKSQLGMNNILDSSLYMVPDNLILLKVEKKWMMENIKNIIKELILNILKQKQ